MAIELAYEKGWHNLWLKCDSQLVIHAIKTINVIPWFLRNRWRNCLILTNRMNFSYSHIFREGNNCEDKLATHGTTIQGFY